MENEKIKIRSIYILIVGLTNSKKIYEIGGTDAILNTKNIDKI